MLKNIEMSSLGFATDWFRPGLMQRPHRHNEVEINFLEAGSLTYLFGGTRARVIKGQLALFWATVPHQVVQVEDSTVLHWLTIPFATFLRWQLPDILTQRIVRGNFALGVPQSEGQSYQQQFRQWYNDLHQPTPELRKVVALEVEACLWRLALSLPPLPTPDRGSGSDVSPVGQVEASAPRQSQEIIAPPAPVRASEPDTSSQSPARHSRDVTISRPDRDRDTDRSEPEVYRPAAPEAPYALASSSSPDQREPGKSVSPVSELSPVERIASFIAEHYTEPLSITQVARAVHLHPNYAMSLFRKNYAISITDYITQYRIAHAQRLLITTGLNVSQIAIESGFGSVSRFYTAFKAVCEQSPGEYRASLTTL